MRNWRTPQWMPITPLFMTVCITVLPAALACGMFAGEPSPTSTPAPVMVSANILTLTPTIAPPGAGDRPEERVIEPTPQPTYTPEPTLTPEPTPTLTPEPSPTSEPTTTHTRTPHIQHQRLFQPPLHIQHQPFRQLLSLHRTLQPRLSLHRTPRLRPNPRPRPRPPTPLFRLLPLIRGQRVT